MAVKKIESKRIQGFSLAAVLGIPSVRVRAFAISEGHPLFFGERGEGQVGNHL